jgi:GNAT superfamily N-acetyltransferase
MRTADGTTGFAIEGLDRVGATVELDSVLKVYSQALMPPPYNKSIADVQMFASIFENHFDRDGFRMFVARADGDVVGFAYGFASRPGGWWRDQVAEALGPRLSVEWLEDCFEFTELAVRPRYEGGGIGSALHDALLDGIEARTAMLSTLQQETRGLRLYERKGWQTLLEDLWFGGTPAPYRVMGLRLAQGD